MEELIDALVQAFRGFGEQAEAAPGGITVSGFHFSVERYGKYVNVDGDYVSRVRPRGPWDATRAFRLICGALPVRRRRAELKAEKDSKVKVLASFVGTAFKPWSNACLGSGVTAHADEGGYSITATFQEFEFFEAAAQFLLDLPKNFTEIDTLYMVEGDLKRIFVRAKSREEALERAKLGAVTTVRQVSIADLVRFLPERWEAK